jgi:hypothetical protein
MSNRPGSTYQGSVKFDVERGRNRENMLRESGGSMAFDPGIGKATQWRKGQSGNAGGRPKSRMLSEALRTRLAEVVPGDPAGRTYAEVVAENLIEIACSEGPGAVHAASEIADRLEGRSRTQVEFADITAELRNKSDAELKFYLDNSRWPSEEEKALLSAPAPTQLRKNMALRHFAGDLPSARRACGLFASLRP